MATKFWINVVEASAKAVRIRIVSIWDGPKVPTLKKKHFNKSDMNIIEKMERLPLMKFALLEI